MQFLRQSTASQAIIIGPFVDDTDGVTAETGLTIDAADIRLSKNGANIVGKNSGGGTHDENGYYTITLDATDTNTVGRLQIHVAESGALPVYHEYQVLEEATYDFLFDNGATPIADINAEVDSALGDYDGPTHAELISEINDVQSDIAALDALTAGEVADAVWDEAQSGHTTAGTFGELATEIASILADTNELQTDDIPGTLSTIDGKINTIDGIVDDILLDTAEIANLNDISTAEVNAEVDTALSDIHLDHLLAADYDPASKPGTATALLNELIESDGGVSRFTDNALEQAPTGGSAPTVGEIADAVWDEAQSGHTTAGTFGEVATEIASILADTNELQTDDIPGTLSTLDGKIDIIDGIVDDILLDTAEIENLDDLTAAEVAAAVWDTVQSSHTTAGSFGEIATEIASILADTNELQTDNTPGALSTIESKIDTIDGIVDDILLDTAEIENLDDLTAAEVADAIWDEATTGHDTAGTFGEIIGVFIDEMLEDDGGTARFTVNALENAPSGSGASAESIADAVWDEAQSGHTTAGTFGELATEIASILADTNELQSDDIPGTLSTIDGKVDTIDGIVDDILLDTAEIANLNDLSAAQVNAEVDTALVDYDGPTHAELVSEINDVQTDIAGLNDPTAGAIADAVWDETQSTHTTAGTFGEVATEIASILADTNELQSDDIPGTLTTIEGKVDTIDGIVDDILLDTAEIANLNDISEAEVNAQVDAALADYDGPTDAEMDAAFAALNDFDPTTEEVMADIVKISGDATAADTLEALMDGVFVAQVNDGGASTTAFVADGFTETTNDHFNGRLITFVGGALDGQQTAITGYNGTTQEFTVEALTEAPANDQFFVIH